MASDSLNKLIASLPWLFRYPFWRASEILQRTNAQDRTTHLILVIANHFEPGYNELPDGSGRLGATLDWDTQQRRLDDWCKQARAIGEAVRDHDGTPFRHTNFYPAEQYHRGLLTQLADLQGEGFGEVEIHLHHGVDKPDTAANFRRVLEDFRDVIADEHHCLSRGPGNDRPRYAFVHGNWALANSANDRWCGVDDEMKILADTGCYADLTLPSAPHVSQVSRINDIYTCGNDLNKRAPHRSGPSVRVGDRNLPLPILLTGPLVFDWSVRKFGVVPRLDNSALTAKLPLGPERLERLAGANIAVGGRPDWIFIKLYCHGFFDFDQPALIGETMRRGLEKSLNEAERTGKFKLHFASAREAFNMTMAAVEGQSGDPGRYRDYRLKQIMAHVNCSSVGTQMPAAV
ncbi:MAG TPA: hypothetical protein VGQ41_14920 [Pyrinomonadaceae bacterium]|jgi:hypothetical protein|nr:hypothetical protein [Pyrinomonadaceae bacterium]